MDKIRRVHLFEASLYAIVLIAALGIPFFSGGFANKGWKVVMFDWVRVLPFILVFLANNYLLVPKLLFREKFLYYFLTCILLVVTVVYLSDFLFNLTRSIRPPFEGMHGGAPDDLFPPDMPPPHGDMPFNGNRPPRDGDFHSGKHIHHFFNFGLAIVSFLLIGFNTGIKSFVRWSEERVRQTEKDKQHLYTELAFLKHQISPHFFMNTLNNIHALVDIDGERAKDAIVRLSRMMRYLLYESEPEKVSLKKEVEFIGSYIELMRLRYDEASLDISFNYPQEIEYISVPAFLFLSFIENAFKHGIRSSGKSFIRLSFSNDRMGRLLFTMENSVGDQFRAIDETPGIGFENIRKRLNILYKDDYRLEISQDITTFHVSLDIPIT